MSSPPPDPAAEEPRYRPWWIWTAPYLGRAPEMSARQWRVLTLIAFVTLFDQYDMGLFSLALKQIQAELQIPEAQLGRLGAIVRLGALPAFFVAMFADRIGRRRVLMWTIAAYTLLTGATALAPDARSFVALQFLARTFAVAEVMLAYVVIAEELDPEHRGWGIGALGALSALGHGLAFIAFSFVEVLPGGWRGLYFIGLGPLLLLTWLRRTLPETTRFERLAQERAAGEASHRLLQPLRDLIRMYPGRLAVVCSVIFLLSFSENAAGFFGPKYFQDEHGWTPGEFAALGVFGGFLGIFGSAFAGRLSDRHGRRRIAILFLLAHPLFAIGYYQLSGHWLAPLWIGSVFTGMGSGVVLSAFGNELFPTSHRSTASGARQIVGTLGGALGLAAESALYLVVGSHWTAISILASLALLAPLLVAAFFPETSGRVLEEISPER